MILNISPPIPERNLLILAGDVGATKTNLAICQWRGNEWYFKKSATYKTGNFRDIISLLTTFLQQEELPEKICLGVAGPVQSGKATMTNMGWEIDSATISQHFRNVPVLLLNDLEATANSLAVMNAKDILVLHEGRKDPAGNVAIIAPGTGLGEAGLYNDRDGYHPFATEGGHCDFSPRTDLDVELYHFLRKKFEHISLERVISGPGICMLYDFLHQVKEREEPAWLRDKILAHDKAGVITEHAQACEICNETVALFIRYLATEAANLVLKLKATGGVFIAGGIVPHLVPVLQEDYFIKWFANAGRLKGLLQDVPVSVLLNEKAPLLGAAYVGCLETVN